MRQIILASKSKQRQEVLKSLCLKFKVIPSRVKEDKKIKSGCARLVEKNALRKARDVAGRTKCGVVIGADTIVLVGKNKIIGKPTNIKDAKKILRILSKKPQWVYTGVAVIDIDNKKEMTDFEKTKVYMRRLTDREIDSYFSKVSPLDKAGSFDIQGRGALFIRRIEGCFYNVVGLPVVKLNKMLKRIGIDVL